MKTYHVFIASSLSFQKERDLMEKVLTERNNSELNIVVHPVSYTHLTLPTNSLV